MNKYYEYIEYAQDGTVLSKGYIIKTYEGDVMLPPASREETPIDKLPLEVLPSKG